MLGRYIAVVIGTALSFLAVIIFLFVLGTGGDTGAAVLVAGSIAVLGRLLCCAAADRLPGHNPAPECAADRACDRSR
jgi:hypothetical protein